MSFLVVFQASTGKKLGGKKGRKSRDQIGKIYWDLETCRKSLKKEPGGETNCAAGKCPNTITH